MTLECSREENGIDEQRATGQGNVAQEMRGVMAAVWRHVVLLGDLSGLIAERAVWRWRARSRRKLVIKWWALFKPKMEMKTRVASVRLL